MKSLLVILMVVFSLSLYAQKNTVISVTADTVQGAETIYLSTETFSFDWESLSIQALCSNIGGTTDGTMTLEGSVDGTSYVALTDESGLVKGFPNDSLTMTDAAVQVWIIQGTPLYKYRIKVAGTSADTTLITPKYIYK